MNRDISILLRWNDFLKYPALYAEPSQIRFLYPDIQQKRLDELLANADGIEVLSRRLRQDLRLDDGDFCPNDLDRTTGRLALLDRPAIWQVGLTAALLSYGTVMKNVFLKKQLGAVVNTIGLDNYSRVMRMAADGLADEVAQRHRFDAEEWHAAAADLIVLWMQSLVEPIRNRVALKFPREFRPALVVKPRGGTVGFQRVCDAMVGQCLATVH